MYQMVRPHIAVPVHGEARHLMAHAAARRALPGAADASSTENGDMVRLAPGPAAVIDEVPVGRLVRRRQRSCCRSAATALQERASAWPSTARRSRPSSLDGAGGSLARAAGHRAGLVAEEDDDAPSEALRERVEQALDELPAARAARRRGGARGGAARRAPLAAAPGYGKKPVTEIHIVVRLVRREAQHDRPAQPRRHRRARSRRRRPRSIATRSAPRCPSRRTAAARMASPSSSSSSPTPRSSCWSRSAPIRRCAAFSSATRAAACTMSATRSTTSAPRATGSRPSGARVLGDGEPKIGAHDKPVLFLHPKDFCGTLIELEQV